MEPMPTLNILIEVLPTGTLLLLSICQVNALINVNNYGSTTTVDDAEVPVMKTTSIQTTKRAMSRIMSERCSSNHQHARLEGGSSCKKAENYLSELAWNLARALLEGEGLSEQACAVQHDAEAQELTGVLRKLGTRHGSEAVRIAYRLHQNPRKDTLVACGQNKSHFFASCVCTLSGITHNKISFHIFALML